MYIVCPFCILRGSIKSGISIPEYCADPNGMSPYAAFHLGIHC